MPRPKKVTPIDIVEEKINDAPISLSDTINNAIDGCAGFAVEDVQDVVDFINDLKQAKYSIYYTDEKHEAAMSLDITGLKRIFDTCKGSKIHFLNLGSNYNKLSTIAALDEYF